jgi:predicted TIM-barrel fold metal-dependent hydrolase
MTVKNDRDYFSKHPEYHMYLHPEFPSYEDQINAKNRLLDKNPGLRFDGAHLGSLEWSVDAMAEHLDRYPNVALDMAERISHLQYQSQRDRQKVIDFFTKYQDRLLYATDIWQEENANLDQLKEYVTNTWTNHWTYFATDSTMTAPEIDGNFQGLKLPKTIVDKIYRLNAEKWFPDAFKRTQ